MFYLALSKLMSHLGINEKKKKNIASKFSLLHLLTWAVSVVF